MLTVPIDTSSGKLGVLLHIGAGVGRDVQAYLEQGFQTICLVEANPTRSQILHNQFQHYPSVHVIDGAVVDKETDTKSRIKLHVLNHPDLSSIRKPEGLYNLLPGIAIVDRPLVRALHMSKLCHDLPELKTVRIHALVVEAPGTELAILEALIEAKGLNSFKIISVTCDSEYYFQGGSRAEDVIHLLERECYTLTKSSRDDPDWPVYQFTRDDAAIELKTLQAQLEKQKTNEIETLQAQLEKQKSQSQELVRNLETLQAELAQARQTLIEIQTSHSDHSKSIHPITPGNELEMALQLQFIAEKDKRDLQDQYARLFDQFNRQNTLLHKLSQALGSAADYLRHHPDIDILLNDDRPDLKSVRDRNNEE